MGATISCGTVLTVAPPVFVAVVPKPYALEAETLTEGVSPTV